MNASDGTNPNENNPNPSRPNDQRKGKGRQKLKMEKIENNKNLQVTFSKRRAGIFKKASELNTLCGAESAVVVFSPGEKTHSYGHPSVETIANKFLNTTIEPTPPTNPFLAAHHEAINRQLNQEVEHLQELIMHERQQKIDLERMFQPSINKKSEEELNRLEDSLLKIKSAFESQLKKASSQRSSSTNVQRPNLNQSGPDPIVGFTNPGGFNTMGYQTVGDPNHWSANSSSYPPPLDPNMGYMVPYPYGPGGSGGASGSNVSVPYCFSNPAPIGDTTTSNSNAEPEDETQFVVSNMSIGRRSRHSHDRGGRS